MQGLEIEVKIEIASPRLFRRKLREAGFVIHRRRVFERNAMFETEPPTLRPRGCVVRLREAGSRFTMTYKGPATVAKHKSREEIEFTVSDAAVARDFLERLGYQSKFIYEKYRTEYKEKVPQGIVTLDETPIGIYAELEGSEEWIDATARLLGIADQDYITASYGALYQQWCAKQGLEPEHMRFR